MSGFPKAQARIRRTVNFTGRVQRVGFRHTAAKLADNFEVEGYIHNLDDGTVELVAEGTPEELDAYVGKIREAIGGNIYSADATDEQATGEFVGFEILAR